MGWWMLWGGLMMVLFWGGIIALAVWAVQGLGRRETGAPQPPSVEPPAGRALDIAKERYARGEMSREQFEEVRRTLEQS
ncbi:MAG: SHOCT domain-containing protein [Dehalococcoidia bacterium]|nr:SHOCT domain-containing protein [Dehalococcoidia bacterium]